MEGWKIGRVEGGKGGRVEDGRLEGWKGGRVEDGRVVKGEDQYNIDITPEDAIGNQSNLKGKESHETIMFVVIVPHTFRQLFTSRTC